MPSEEEIIIIGGGKQPKSVITTVKPQGVAKPRDVLKQYSTWALLFILAGPDLYQAALATGLIGQGLLTDIMRGLAAAGLVLKFIQQTKPADS